MGIILLFAMDQMKLTLILLFVGPSCNHHFVNAPERGIQTQVCGDDGTTYWNKCLADCNNVNVACQGACPCDDSRLGPSLQSSLCQCPRGGIPTQVCGDDGTTYWNKCLADCSNVTVACQGACPCDDSRLIDPRIEIGSDDMESGIINADIIDGCTDDAGKRHRLNEFYVARDGCNKCRCTTGGGACTRRLCLNNIFNAQRFQEMFDGNSNDVKESNSVCNCPKTMMMVCGANGQTYMNSCLAQCDQTLVMHIGQCNSNRALIDIRRSLVNTFP